MYSTLRVVRRLAKFAANYTADLAVPFADNAEANECAETPILIIADICKLIGLTHEQTRKVLGEDGSAFVAYLNQPVDASKFLAGLTCPVVRVPIAGTAEGGVVTFGR